MEWTKMGQMFFPESKWCTSCIHSAGHNSLSNVFDDKIDLQTVPKFSYPRSIYQFQTIWEDHSSEIFQRTPASQYHNIRNNCDFLAKLKESISYFFLLQYFLPYFFFPLRYLETLDAFEDYTLLWQWLRHMKGNFPLKMWKLQVTRSWLTHCSSVLLSYTPWKHQEA